MSETFDSNGLLAELDSLVETALARIGELSSRALPAADVTIASLLEIALKNELEASEEAALWMTSERDVEVKIGLARQCGDEAKHYRLIEERLRSLGVDVASIDVMAKAPSPMYRYLESLTTTIERVAAGPFAREALAGVRNEVFAAYCESKGDLETARLYREIINPDESHHHALGRHLLARLVTTDSERALAVSAASKTLALAEELQETARLKLGVARAPGC